MTSFLLDLSTREPSPFAETRTTPLLLGFCGLLATPANLLGSAGAKVAVKAAILGIKL